MNREPNANRPKVVVGKGQNTNLKGDKSSLYTNIFVYRVEKGTSVESVESHMSSNGVSSLECEKKSGSVQKHDSFRVCIKKEDWNKVMKPDFWPEGIRCRYFHPPRKSSYLQESPHHSVTSSEMNNMANHHNLSRHVDDEWHRGFGLDRSFGSAGSLESYWD